MRNKILIGLPLQTLPVKNTGKGEGFLEKNTNKGGKKLFSFAFGKSLKPVFDLYLRTTK